jgi:hypothetical protein
VRQSGPRRHSAARAFSEAEQIVYPYSSAVDALGSLVSGEPYEAFKLDWCPVEHGSFRCAPVVPAPGQPGCLIIDDGDGNLVDPEGAIVGGISYGYSNEGSGRVWLLRRVVVRALKSAWRCEYRYQP